MLTSVPFFSSNKAFAWLPFTRTFAEWGNNYANGSAIDTNPLPGYQQMVDVEGGLEWRLRVNKTREEHYSAPSEE